MGTSKSKKHASSQNPCNVFHSSSREVDPILASLFASSSGPVKVAAALPKVNASKLSLAKDARSIDATSDLESDSNSSDTGNEELNGSERSSKPSVVLKHALDTSHKTPPKRRKLDRDEDLEASYFQKLALEEERERVKDFKDRTAVTYKAKYEGIRASGAGSVPNLESVANEIPIHESFDRTAEDDGGEKMKRTVFLGNVSTEAIKSKTSRKLLIKYLESLSSSKSERNDNAKVESLRFRSTAFAGGVGPKRAAFAKKELMEQTMRSTNAYAVFTSEVAAKMAVAQLSGSIILDRHLKVDSVANPSKIDHKRCVFVGNLAFVDDETMPDDGDHGESNQRRAKSKAPADAEEGLWRTFSNVGRVESVRVVRDNETRVGKGFAYVQFAEENDVEAALLMNDKKFPPMLPRKLRVMRARRMTQHEDRRKLRPGQARRPEIRNGKPIRKKDLRSARYRRLEGRQQVKGIPIVFEGHRASAPTRKGASKFSSIKFQTPRTENEGYSASKANDGVGQRQVEK